MRNCLACVAVLCLGFALPQNYAHAEQTIMVASLPYTECYEKTIYSPEIVSACITVGEPQDKFREVVGNKIRTFEGYRLPPIQVEDRFYPHLRSVRVVRKRAVRRLIVNRSCASAKCQFVSVQTQYGRQLARQLGVQTVQGIAGFLVPIFPLNIVAGAVACAAVSVAFDAAEYRQDYKEEPQPWQYGESFKNNLVNCSPVGGLVNAQNPLQVMLALLGLSSYFVALPQPLVYGQQGLMVANWASSQQAARSVSQAKRKNIRQAAQ